MAEAAADERPASRRVAALRLGVGLAQGLCLALLVSTMMAKTWPSTSPAISAPLLIVLMYVPLIVIGGLGRIRPIPLAAWTSVAAVVLAIFAWHDIEASIWSGIAGATKRSTPEFPIFLFGAVFVFVGHHLVGPADEAKRLIAPYPLYFDWAWKDAVQLGLSLVFVGVLWLALELGSALFGLIGIKAIGKIIETPWFAWPASCVAFAAAVELTDVRVALIRGVRTVALVLLSWLLPVATAIVVAFLAALPFTGLGKLFGASSGAATVLAASAGLIVLVSAAYQDGKGEVPRVLRWAARAAGLALIPLVLIAADALWLRVGEYGLTPSRIEAIACALVAAGFAAGYGLAAVRRKGPWMQALELTNVIMARLVMVAILLLFTPIADPARLGVGDQVSRLLAGKVQPDKFDFAFLTYHAGRYGAEALKALAGRKGTPRDVQIAQFAVAGQTEQQPQGYLKPVALAARLDVYPAGAKLPPTFLAQNWNPDNAGPYEPCFTNTIPSRCDAIVLDIDGDGAPEVLLAQQTLSATGDLDVYKQAAGGGAWGQIGQLDVGCADAYAALKAGQAKLVPRTGVDLQLGGIRQVFIPSGRAPCAATAPATNATSP
jgi:hypothetical protein